MKALVFCPANQYKHFIVENHLDPREYKHIYTTEAIHGFKDTVMLDLSDAFLIEDWKYIEHYCASHNIDILRVYI